MKFNFSPQDIKDLYNVQTMAIVRKCDLENFEVRYGRRYQMFIILNADTVLLVLTTIGNFYGGILIPRKYLSLFMQFSWGKTTSFGRASAVSSSDELRAMTSHAYTYSYHLVQYLDDPVDYGIKVSQGRKYEIDHINETFNDCNIQYILKSYNRKKNTSHQRTAIITKENNGYVLKNYIALRDSTVFECGSYLL